MFKILREGNKVNSRTTALAFRGTAFFIVRDLMGRVTWEMNLKTRRNQENWLIFKDHFLQAQERSIPTSRKSSKSTRRPAWLSRELLTELSIKKEVYKRWKQGQMTQEEFRNSV